MYSHEQLEALGRLYMEKCAGFGALAKKFFPQRAPKTPATRLLEVGMLGLNVPTLLDTSAIKTQQVPNA